MRRKRPSAVQVKQVISATSLGSTQWTRESTSGEPKRVLRGGGMLRGDVLRTSDFTHPSCILDAIQGHAARTAGDSYGDVTVNAMAQAMERVSRVEV